jgi:hypothetical protein
VPKHLSDDDLARWFAYHSPTDDAIRDAHEQIRAGYGELAQQMNNLLPEGPDKTVALRKLRKLREAMWGANAAVACAQATYGHQQAGPAK